MTTPETVRVHSLLLGHGHQCARLWYLCRGLDSDGCGWVSLPTKLMASLLQVSERTIQRYCKQGLERGWFRKIVTDAERPETKVRGNDAVNNSKAFGSNGLVVREYPETKEVVTKGSKMLATPENRACLIKHATDNTTGQWVTIYYTSLPKVAAKLGVSGLGAIADVSIDHLIGRSKPKALCTLLDALYKQKQSYFAASSAEKGQGKKRILKPWEVAASVKSPGVRAMKVVSEPLKCPGASIAGIAKDSGWSISTIKRRLSNQWRKDRGIDCVTKRRVAIAIDDPQLLHEMGEANETFLIQGSKVLRIWNDSGRNTLLRMGCNVYDAAYELLSCRRLRWRCSKC